MESVRVRYEPSWADVFSDQEIDNILNLVEKYDFTDGKIFGNANDSVSELSDHRRSKIKWIDYNEESSWIYHKVSDIVLKMNLETYQFSLKGCEPIQYSTYSEDISGTYDFHVDLLESSSRSRKTSVSILLSDPDSYEGGDLVLSPSGGGNLVIPKRCKGRAIIFPSWVPHKVTPVSKGTRISLVFWFYGDKFL